MLRKASHTRRPFRTNRVGRPSSRRVGRGALRAVVLALALIGFLHLTRGTAVRHVRGVAADGAAIGVAEPEFPLMATMATGAWLAPGNRVEVTQNGDGTFPAAMGRPPLGAAVDHVAVVLRRPGSSGGHAQRDPA